MMTVKTEIKIIKIQERATVIEQTDFRTKQVIDYETYGLLMFFFNVFVFRSCRSAN